MLATTKRAAIVALWLVCCYYDQAATHDHVRTKSSSRAPRAQQLATGMPAVTVAARSSTVSGGRSTDSDADTDADVDTDTETDTDTEIDTDTAMVPVAKPSKPQDTGRGGLGGLGNFLFRKPNKIFKSLMRTSVRVVQRGMDAFQGVSNKVYRVARKQIGGSRAGGSSSASAGKSDEGSDRTPVKRQADAVKKPTGFVKRVAKMLDTGIAGIEQVTDLGLLLGNIGTHKIMAKLDGKSGNQEIFKMLVKYVGSKVGKGAKGSVTQFINDVGTVSTFAATDDEVTTSISLIMEKFMSNPKVSAAMVRLVLTVLDGSPSTACLLDQLPLSPQDVRMVLDVFVGSNGQMMLKTIAGLVSDLTTGPDTKAFLESALGMMSMFKSDTPGPVGGDNSEKPTSIVGSLTSFFTGDDGEEDDYVEDDVPEKSTPPPIANNIKKASTAEGNAPKPSAKKPAKPKADDDWFTKTESTFEAPKKKAKSNEDPWFVDTGTTTNSLPKKPAKPKLDDFFEKSATNSVHGSENGSDKKNVGRKKEESGSLSTDSTDNTEPISVTTSKKSVAKMPNSDVDDDFDILEEDEE
ncbi:uncharacterized protein LOC111034376 isoform X2 [Myzus persicae]|uniref:uncharacterized protein LOC111034376 isoform X2 n=1 Tax=Myzus persicae TaxID=13164 RepID=UPI000B938B4E|nr:uncharacterized protein LOC111034376 isoform X2 [Myzus persicae]